MKAFSPPNVYLIEMMKTYKFIGDVTVHRRYDSSSDIEILS